MSSTKKDYDEILKTTKERHCDGKAEWVARRFNGDCVMCGEEHEIYESFCDVCEEIQGMTNMDCVLDITNEEIIHVCIHCELPIPITTIDSLEEIGIFEEMDDDDDVDVDVDLIKNNTVRWVCNLPEGYEIPQED